MAKKRTKKGKAKGKGRWGTPPPATPGSSTALDTLSRNLRSPDVLEAIGTVFSKVVVPFMTHVIDRALQETPQAAAPKGAEPPSALLGIWAREIGEDGAVVDPMVPLGGNKALDEGVGKGGEAVELDARLRAASRPTLTEPAGWSPFICGNPDCKSCQKRAN